MNVFIWCILLINVIFVLTLCSYKVIRKKNEWLDYLPSIVWQLLMIVPFLIQAKDMGDVGNNTQGIGLLFFSFIIFIGDNYKMKEHAKFKLSDKYKIFKLFNRLARNGWFYFVIFLLLAGYHIISMGENIPWIYKILHSEASSGELSVMRENSLKLLNVPFYMKYFFRWNTNIIVPIGLLWFLKDKKYISAGIFVVLGGWYAVLTDAEGPLVLFCGIIVIFLLYKHYKKIPVKIVLLSCLIVLIIAIRPISYFAFNENSPFHCEYTAFKEEPLANRMPYMDLPDDFPTEYRVYNKFFRRIVLVPAVVANNWYKYAIINNKYFGYGDMLPWARMGNAAETVQKAPSNIVGIWAYTERFPESYGSTISANTSMDADAYARGGWIAFLVTGGIYLGIRLLMKWFNSGEDELIEMCYVIGVSIIAMVLTSAPIQAILIAQGVFPLIIAMFVLRE